MKKYKTVKGLLDNESRWCKFAAAKNANDVSVSETSKDAYKFCLLGAMGLVYGEAGLSRTYGIAEEKLVKAIQKFHPRIKSIAYFNDRVADHAEIKKVLKEANI
jgi:hypothetical protein